MSIGFENYAGRDGINDALVAELEAAGIRPLHLPRGMTTGGEVEAGVFGSLHGWKFTRAWCYWVAEGPGIPPVYATTLYLKHGTSVRVDGHCGCPSPVEQFKGFAVGRYHVDDAVGLKALADMLNTVVEDQARVS